MRRWAESAMGWGPDRVEIHTAPQLSTPGFDLVVLAQPGVRSGGDLYVMTDGDRVLPAGAGNLGAVLAQEGLASDPSALPPELVAELFFRMAEVGRGRPITEAGDRALAAFPEEARAEFAPPSAVRDGDGVRLAFWSERGMGGEVERWDLRLGEDGALDYTTG